MLVIFILQWVNFICTKWVNSIDNQHPGISSLKRKDPSFCPFAE